MTNCDEINELIGNIEKENEKIELKKSNILKSPKVTEKIARQIVAFANKKGGKLILGIMDDGTYEGKKIFDLDFDKGKIENILHANISPKINCEIEFLECDNAHLLIINIPKKKDIPHAYVRKTRDGHISSRNYFIRTSHGVRPISDRELQFLFKEPDINFNYKFRIIVNYLRESLKIPSNLLQPEIVRTTYRYFLHSLFNDHVEVLLKSIDNISNFVSIITPYIFINSLAEKFYQSWKIEEKGKFFQDFNTTVPKKKISIENLIVIPTHSIISSLSLDFKNYLTHLMRSHFYIPINTEIQIVYNKNNYFSQVLLNNPDFCLEISFSQYQWGSGIETNHPQISSFYQNDSFNEIKIHETFGHIQIVSEFKATFNFPEINFELYNYYIQYANFIRKVLEEEWNYDNFLKKLPHGLLFAFDRKINDILNLLKK